MARKKYRKSKKSWNWLKGRGSFRLKALCLWGTFFLLLMGGVWWGYYFFSHSRPIPIVPPLGVLRIPLKAEKMNPYNNHARHLYRYIQGEQSVEMFFPQQKESDKTNKSFDKEGKKPNENKVIIREKGRVVSSSSKMNAFKKAIVRKEVPGGFQSCKTVLDGRVLRKSESFTRGHIHISGTTNIAVKGKKRLLKTKDDFKIYRGPSEKSHQKSMTKNSRGGREKKEEKTDSDSKLCDPKILDKIFKN